jgi:hypothetical protein
VLDVWERAEALVVDLGAKRAQRVQAAGSMADADSGRRRGARKSAEDMATMRTHGSEGTTGSEEDDVPRHCELDDQGTKELLEGASEHTADKDLLRPGWCRAGQNARRRRATWSTLGIGVSGTRWTREVSEDAGEDTARRQDDRTTGSNARETEAQQEGEE